MEAKMTIEQLVEINKQINDKRTKAFKALKAKIKEVALPALCKVLEQSDKNCTYLLFDNMPYDGMTREYWDSGECGFVLFVFADGTIKEGYCEVSGEDGKMHFHASRYVTEYNIESVDIKSDAINEFYVKVVDKIEKMNRKLQRVTEITEKNLQND